MEAVVFVFVAVPAVDEDDADDVNDVNWGKNDKRTFET